jgi:hypothetical protein
VPKQARTGPVLLALRLPFRVDDGDGRPRYLEVFEMRTIMFLAIGLFLTAGAPANAHDDCCSHECCANASDVSLVVPSTEALPAPEVAPTPVREYAEVLFQNPVWVHGKVLMGRYVIEHDTDRMAKGKPCTHIYDADDRGTPVVTFHCTHLIRPINTGEQAKVTLRRDYNVVGTGYILTEFQFAGSRDAHGVPGVRGVELTR